MGFVFYWQFLGSLGKEHIFGTFDCLLELLSILNIFCQPVLFKISVIIIIYLFHSASKLSQTSFSLYLHNQWTYFHKLSYAGKPQMRDICTYMGYTKATTNDWDIRLSVAVKAFSANISGMAEQICTIELALESVHQSIYNDIWCVSKQ